jgi:Ca-activated chloride channel family protein
MNFQRLDLLPYIIIGVTIFSIGLFWYQKKFFKIVKLYWFYERSFFHYLSTLLYLAGFFLLSLALLDPRGPDEKVKVEVPESKTIILIDTSASMLAEDVQPSRLSKAVLVAKHFARKAAGQQISIVAFAEIQKKIVPFTSDLDLIDARLDSIKNLKNQNGSSAISISIQESIQYFKEVSKNPMGNIIVITDGEETVEPLNLKIPKEIKLAFVGIGTERGGRIPLDDRQGFRFGYKKTKGQDVITKLNENFFKSAVAEVPESKYWIVNSYSLPTDEIKEFFSGINGKNKSARDMTIRPVKMELFIIPAILLLVFAFLFKMIRVYSLPRAS